MKQFAIIGLGAFGQRMLESLLEITNEIIIIDKEKDIIEKFKDSAKAAYITDAINEAALKKIIPAEVDAVIVDLGGKIEFSLMTTAYLKKMGIKDILVKAQSDEHGEILEALGATRVVYPDKEAAEHITPLLVSSFLFNFFPIGENLALAEIRVNEYCLGKNIIEIDLRKNFELNLVAMRKEGKTDFDFLSDLTYRFAEDDVLLLAGHEDKLLKFSSFVKRKEGDFFGNVFNTFFKRKN